MKRKILLFALMLLSVNVAIYAQRPMEDLGRGLVAVKVTDGVFLSWRITGQEWYDVQYNVYRAGTKLNAQPLNVSNFTDTGGSLNSTYTVKPVLNGVEGEECSAVSVLPNQYLEIKMRKIMKNGRDYSKLYSLNDATVADLDGDGEMEVIIKRMNTDFSVKNDSAYTYFEAYKLDGTFMWAIDCGPNLVSSGHVETNIAAFDFDGDGKAEVIMRTADGTIDGQGNVIGSATANYRSYVNQTANMQYMVQGPEFLSVFDGETGEELDRVDYIARGKAGDWGDDYGHRCNKFFFGAPYLDGRKPSILITRGIYTRIVMRTYDLVNKKLVRRWAKDFDTNQWTEYAYQGNHNYTVADVDGDGRDEIVYGSMTVDEYGEGLYSTGYGHGDAIHVGDFDPYHKGTEIFACLESSPHWGAAFRDGATNETFIKYVHGRDCGRCCAGNVTDDFPGAQLWSGGNMWSASTRERVGSSGGAENFILYWDGDLLQETFDYTNVNDVTGKGYGTPAIFKYNNGTVFVANGTATNNYTKGNPSMQVDIFGDWREELILRTTDDMALRIYTTINPTEYRNYTLLHDHQYRQAIYWQMCGYNQPPHVSYFLGKMEGITVPPPPAMTNGRLEAATQIDATGNGQHLLLADTQGGSVAVNGTLTPTVLTVNSPMDYTFAGTGIFGGNMRFIKQGMGALTFGGNHSYTGATELWDGVTNFEGTLSASPVLMKRFAEMNTSATFGAGLTMEYGAILRIAGATNKGVVQTKELTLQKGAVIEFDLHDLSSSETTGDRITITGDLNLDAQSIFRFITYDKAGTQTPEAGDYLIMEVGGKVEGDLSKVVIEGLPGVACSLKQEAGKIYLAVQQVRQPGEIVWGGTENSNIWEQVGVENFLLAGEQSYFVSGDNVLFTDAAANKTVDITTAVYPATVTVDNTETYTFSGAGKISGEASLIKKGTGTLQVNNANDYTGKTRIEGGTVVVSSLSNLQTIGALGAKSSDPSNFVITNNATLQTSGNVIQEGALTVGDDGGIFDVASGTLTLQGVVAGGTLVKTGSGTLEVSAVNTHKQTILKAGTLKVVAEPNDQNGYFGDTLVLEGGTVQCLDNNGSYSKAAWNIVVPQGKSARINLDGRCSYTGSLTGSGTLTISSPYVRSDIAGDWSEFTGTITTVGDELRINNSYGFTNGILNLAASTLAYNEKGTAFQLGGVTGSGTLGGSSAWIVGSNNKNSSFSGKITSSLTKVGTGTLTLSGENTFSGITEVKGGTLMANNSNKLTSATGGGALTVYEGGILSGRGVIANSRVELLSGGVLKPGYFNVGELSMPTILTVREGGVIEYRLNANESVTTIQNLRNMAVYGTIRITLKDDYVPKKGDSFLLWSSRAFNSASAATFELPQLPEGLGWDTGGVLAKEGILKISDASSIKSVEMDEVVKVTVVSMGGTVLHQGTCRYEEVDTYIHDGHLNAGVYLITIDTTQGRIVRKTIK